MVDILGNLNQKYKSKHQTIGITEAVCQDDILLLNHLYIQI